MTFWLVPLSGCCHRLIFVVESVAGAGEGRFRNDTLGGVNAGCTGVAGL